MYKRTSWRWSGVYTENCGSNMLSGFIRLLARQLACMRTILLDYTSTAVSNSGH